mmetsp:Transcript_38067/g.90444  ORF Transcript_38067/g.90444 Transcript_38067/m.90444 type:complete len:213 (+) Transcript_38067:2777-3415(+)
MEWPRWPLSWRNPCRRPSSLTPATRTTTSWRAWRCNSRRATLAARWGNHTRTTPAQRARSTCSARWTQTWRSAGTRTPSGTAHPRSFSACRGPSSRFRHGGTGSSRQTARRSVTWTTASASPISTWTTSGAGKGAGITRGSYKAAGPMRAVVPAAPTPPPRTLEGRLALTSRGAAGGAEASSRLPAYAISASSTTTWAPARRAEAKPQGFRT